MNIGLVIQREIADMGGPNGRSPVLSRTNTHGNHCNSNNYSSIVNSIRANHVFERFLDFKVVGCGGDYYFFSPFSEKKRKYIALC